MTDSHLLPFSVTAQRVRISHNEHKASGETALQFVRNRGLTAAFSSRKELRHAVERNELWLLDIVRADSTRRELVAGARFVSLVTRDSESAMAGADCNVTPPLPRHDDIVIECVREGAVSETWTMTWREYAGYRYALKSVSLREVMRRGLEISAGNANGVLLAFEQWSVAH